MVKIGKVTVIVMRIVDSEMLKAIMDKGEIVIDEDVEKCESMHEVLVYLLEKVAVFLDEAIDGLPTVEAKPVVHGEWLERDWFPFNLYCSVCGKEDAPYDFCPNCGADMRGEKRE